MSGNSRISTKYCCFPKEGWRSPVLLQVRYQDDMMTIMFVYNEGSEGIRVGVGGNIWRQFVKRRNKLKLSIQLRIFLRSNINSESTYKHCITYLFLL